jgi:ATP-dependent RNA helicase RhlE
VKAERIHGNRSQAQRTQALAGFKTGEVQVLVATDIVARGIDVEELGHVVNFDVPHMPEDYIHRVGRTARAEATGDAITFVSPEEESDLRAIEKAIGKKIVRKTLAGFDYANRPTERFEIPIAERIAEIRKRKAEERARAKVKAERKAQMQSGGGASNGRSAPRPASSGSSRPAAVAGAPAPRRDETPYANERATAQGGGGNGGSNRRRGRGGRGRGPGSTSR